LFIKDGSIAGTFNIGVAKGSAAVNATFGTVDYAVNTDYIIVLKYQIITGSNNDACSVFVFSGSIPASEPAATVSATNLTDSALTDLAQVSSFAIRQGSVGTSAGIIDGLRVSSTWSNAQLPVTWKSFSATKSAVGNVLKWSTASEVNTAYFEVQRSIDGRLFEAIGKIKAGWNSTKVLNYEFSDKEKNTSKLVYYRLRQVDTDGRESYSKTVSVVNNDKKAVLGATLPNPFSEELSVNIDVTFSSTATIMLVDMIGKVHYTSTEVLTIGMNKISLSTVNMPNGIYFVRVSANGESFTQKVIKK
jgi:hypothetical protein